jgi:ABC-type multidrug transport system fused ATPase/permease subunit
MKTLPKIKGDIIEYFYNYIQHNSHEFFQQKLAGDITNKIMETTKSVEYFISNFNEFVVRKSTAIIAALITIYWVNYNFAIVFSLWLAAFTAIHLLFAPKVLHLSASMAAKKSQVAGKIVDAISNIVSIRMFRSHNYEKKYLNYYITEFIQSDVKWQWFLLKMRLVLGPICSIMILGMVYYLTNLRALNLVTVGDFVLIISICSDLISDVWDLSEEIGNSFEDYGSFKQSCTLLSSYHVVDSPSANKLIITSGRIEFVSVVFQYKDQNILFNEKSITIPGKSKIGLVGYSGSGKTSFVNLINRLYDISSGKILIDGQEISKVTMDSLRKAISYIPQDPILFHRSIMENIRYGNFNASDEEVFEAAKKAHIHQVIMNMPEQYNSLCGEKGGNLSGGQRQRIVIARAILKNAPILILDEATSSLDSLTEKLIQDSLEFLMHDKTVLVIAHRLATILAMDKIFVFENGKIVENATHQELLEKRGLYHQFWQSQIKGFLIN